MLPVCILFICWGVVREIALEQQKSRLSHKAKRYILCAIDFLLEGGACYQGKLQNLQAVFQGPAIPCTVF